MREVMLMRCFGSRKARGGQDGGNQGYKVSRFPDRELGPSVRLGGNGSLLLR